MTKYRLVLSVEAERDLENLYTEGYAKWGELQADTYFDHMLDHFEALCDNPYAYRQVDEIREGYRRSVCGKHSVFYRVLDNAVEIMALVKYENRP